MPADIDTNSLTQTRPESHEDRWRRSRGGRFALYARQAVVMLVALAVIVGVIYPLFITGIGQAFFRHQANGSLIVQNGTIAGSELIGQPFNDPGYFWSRPSATSPVPYNAGASTGSNLGPTNPALLTAIADRIAALRAADPGNDAPVPIDLVTASASGLDPAHQPGGGGIPGGAGGASPRDTRGCREKSRREVH